MGTRAGLGILENKESLACAGNWTLNCSAHIIATVLTELCRLHNAIMIFQKVCYIIVKFCPLCKIMWLPHELSLLPINTQVAHLPVFVTLMVQNRSPSCARSVFRKNELNRTKFPVLHRYSMSVTNGSCIKFCWDSNKMFLCV